MKIAVAGTGYVGLVTGVCLAHKGHQVTCVDINEEKVAMMSRGESPIYEPGLPELMKESMENLCFTTDYRNAYSDAEVIFIGVGTPEKSDGSANLAYVYEAAKQIAQSVERDCVVVLKSTVPIGTILYFFREKLLKIFLPYWIPHTHMGSIFHKQWYIHQRRGFSQIICSRLKGTAKYCHIQK